MEELHELTGAGEQKRLSIGKRIAHWLHRLNSGRYEDYVPLEIRELGESRGAPKPNIFVPSIEGRRVSIPQPIEAEEPNPDLNPLSNE
jgi:hypothetical protein